MIPDMKKYRVLEKISSGINGYDELIDGGFIKQTVNVINGEPGTGKTVFGAQFLYKGAQEGKNGLCILTATSALSFKTTMFSSFNWDFLKMENSELITIVDYSDPYIRLLSFNLNPKDYVIDFIDRVRYLIEYFQPNLVYIDSIESIFLFADRIYTFKFLIDKLFDTLKSYDIISLVTVGTTFNMERLVEYSADSITRLGRVVSGNELKRSIYIAKARGSRTTNEIREFEISDIGIVILNKSPYTPQI